MLRRATALKRICDRQRVQNARTVYIRFIYVWRMQHLYRRTNTEDIILKILYIHHANIDNSYDERWAKIYIPNMKNIQGKAGLFGGKFSFKYEGQEYKFKLPSKAGKFVDFFVK